MIKTMVSFVIPHKGRENFLQQTLDALVLQEYDQSLMEVIVATQNDVLAPETLRYQEKVNLKVFPRPDSDSISALRNYGAHQAQGEYLAFLDADISLSPNWINCMLDELKDSKSNRVLISAIQKNSAEANSVEKIRTALNNTSKDSNHDSLAGSNLFLKAETFKKAGGFPEELITCEDIYFTNKVNELGDLYLTSRATFIHLGEDKDHKQMFRKEIWRSLSNLLSMKGRKVPLRELPSILIPIVQMLLFVTTIFFLISQSYSLSLISVLLILTPVLAYSIRLQIKLANQQIRFFELVAFYIVYFSARSIGAYKGLFKFVMN